MDSPFRIGLLCSVGILLGLLLVSIAPEMGAGVIFAVCGLILIVWACRS